MTYCREQLQSSGSTTASAASESVEQAIAQLIEGDFHSRWDSAKQFSRQFAELNGRLSPAETHHTLTHLIHHLQTQQDPETQWFLIRILSQFDQPMVVQAIAQLLASTPDEDLQIEAGKPSPS